MILDLKQSCLSQRRDAFQDLLRENDLEGYLLTHLSDLYYFTDYRAEGYAALMGLKEAWLILPNLLFQQGKDATRDFICLKGRLFPLLKEILQKNKFKKLGFDPVQLDYGLGASLVKMGFKPVPGLASRLRKIKDAFELNRLRSANHLAALGATHVKTLLKPGKTEKQVAAELAYFFSLRGDGIAFDLIIAAGPHSAYPHHINGDYRIKKGDPVICDIGALWQGYRSDLTRTLTLGKLAPLFQRIYNLVDAAQKRGIKQIRPGVTAESVDSASRNFIQRNGYGPAFVHSTGHGVGIDIHEDPRLGPGIKDILRSGMVVTVEPGIYLPGKFGVRIEDTLLVTPNGSEVLTR